jgi:hypothetical protein
VVYGAGPKSDFRGQLYYYYPKIITQKLLDTAEIVERQSCNSNEALSRVFGPGKSVRPVSPGIRPSILRTFMPALRILEIDQRDCNRMADKDLSLHAIWGKCGRLSLFAKNGTSKIELKQGAKGR